MQKGELYQLPSRRIYSAFIATEFRGVTLRRELLTAARAVFQFLFHTPRSSPPAGRRTVRRYGPVRVRQERNTAATTGAGWYLLHRRFIEPPGRHTGPHFWVQHAPVPPVHAPGAGPVVAPAALRHRRRARCPAAIIAAHGRRRWWRHRPNNRNGSCRVFRYRAAQAGQDLIPFGGGVAGIAGPWELMDGGRGDDTLGA